VQARAPDPGSTPAQRAAEAIHHALARGFLRPQDAAAVFHDLGLLDARLARIRAAFPPQTLHAVAIKANPLRRILERLRALDAGAEVASWPELRLALSAGFPPERIVFDSPAKTIEELRQALSAGVRVNADNLDEIERIAALRRELSSSASAVGIRINPQVGAGRIAATSTAAAYSKFGVALLERREELLHAFVEHDWLRGVHVHVGSQGCSLELLVEAVRRLVEFADEVEGEQREAGAFRVETIDIGGGLPIAYQPGDVEIPVEDYAAALRATCPALFEGRYGIITEFGRYLFAPTGWIASRVEYVKTVAGIPTAILHVGADILSRECQDPESWRHAISVHAPDGTPRLGGEERWNLAGPLCYSGDMPAVGVPLPRIHAGDFVVFHDTGAYALSMWSRYNSRQVPRVLGYESPGWSFQVLKERERPEDVIAFWE